jgi:ABC-type multidrug transport system fused ATPase/permease subunit
MGILTKLTSNFIFDTYRRVILLLTPSERRRGVFLAVLSIFGAIVDVMGLAALVPVMLAATDPGFVQKNAFMARLYAAGGFASMGSFMVALSVALLLVFIFKGLVGIYLYHVQSRYAFGVGTDIARRQFIKFYNRGFTHFQNTNSAEVMNQVMNIPTFFTSSVLVSAINFFVETLVILFILIGIALTDYRLLFLLSAVLIPAGFLTYNGTKNHLVKLGREQSSLYNASHSKLVQSIFGYADVRINNKEEVFLNDFVQAHSRLNRNNQLRYLIGLIPTKSLEVIAVLGITITFVYTYLITKDPEQLYSFIAVFAAAAFRLLPSLNRILTAVMGMKSHQFALESLENGGLPEELDDMEIKHIPFNDKIEFRNVSFRYNDSASHALHNLNLKVRKGEKVGIIGTSGSGKTTLMNILLRFLVEQEGGLYVDGYKIERKDRRSWREMVGYVKQDVYLMDASLRENIAFGVAPDEIDDARVLAAAEAASLSEFIQGLPQGILTNVGEHGSKISGGQKQRIGIARALYANSKVLVFDEATSALDNETEQSITDSIENLVGQTIFVVAHRVTSLRFCDRIIDLRNGELVGEYTYEEVIRRAGL